MKNVSFNPTGDLVAVKTQDRILDALLAKELNVMMACGGKGMCSTCHVVVESGMDKLTPITDRERRTLQLVTGCGDKSRLACQARILGEGVTVRLPDGVFVESTQDLTTLIGRRTERNILHPIDGRVLIEKGKIITKSRIMELKDLDFDMANLRTRAAAED